MNDALDLVKRALDSASVPRTFFVRDDDGGWNAPALERLLAVAADTGIPVDLAVIPAALSETEAGILRAFSRASGVLRAHQHGYAHVNHEEQGRKCEFGPSRSAEHQRADIRFGRGRLLDLLDGVVDPIFTPPWNRCTQATIDALHAEGFAAISRDLTAQSLDRRSIAEIPVTADWGKPGGDPGRCLALIADQIAANAGAIGLMTHHATLDEASLDALRGLFELWANHPKARPTAMNEVIAIQEKAPKRAEGSGL